MIASGKFTTLPGNVQMSHQFPLASSMDLLSSKAPLLEHHSEAFQDISIHGTLPRKKRGPLPIKPLDTFSYMRTFSYAKTHSLHIPLIQDVIKECPSQGRKEKLTFRDQSVLGPTTEYVKFSKGKYIMDAGTPEKLKKELEEELKLSSEDLRSHAWYHGCIPRQVSESLVQRDGDFLIRDSLSSPGNFVLTCQWKNAPHHFKINKAVVRLNEAYCRVQYQLDRESFDNVPALVRYYVGNRKSVSEQNGPVIFQPINRSVPLRCTEERYGASPLGHKECITPEGKAETLKRLSLDVCKGQVEEQNMMRGNLLRNKEKSGSQPACLDHVQKRRPLKAHQSESYLPIGSRHSSQIMGTDAKLCPKSPVFRTGSEPTLSPTTGRRFTYEAQEALRGSDSQLCPKPPPKPSKVPLMTTPSWPSSETNYCELNPTPPTDWEGTRQRLFSPNRSSMECLPASEETGQASSRNSKISYLNLDSEDSICQSSRDALREQDDKEGKENVFVKPVFETISSFKPNNFESPLLLPENKPLETLMLRRAKELFTNNHPRIIAKHILKMDCKVARILEVSTKMKRMMGVSSGLELITLPYGHQLRLDIIERHNTMAIGIAVDILGCTGNLEERVATLNKIIQVAVELKDSMGDLYAFSAIMKALDMPQIMRLEQTWTSLRHQYTQTAITYEKQLKPFSKALHEGMEALFAPQSNVTVPLLMPLVTLLERQTAIFEGLDVWENNDRGCEIMLNHLEASRHIAQNAERYRMNAERILEGFSPDDEMSDVFKTEFQMRLLWGSKGAQVSQAERYQKFSQILTALSRKLEPPQT
ncbi:breast cancer anti-estrogen resistance protein 3 isoform X2 [Microcaecilia unicolor]|nr:breast cancer anti-estrogen resistance protein 3 isoform X2 [Microcaecilia unicolor]XP_030061995.1 breast cancer anti-estrogen resistance protein 3 isoform X2 [Microcaecilia unicolor]XP_030061996.1 breast cancer anti-estrogen resistance protein 3 isoform X2 [Microcaecilia unicolor]